MVRRWLGRLVALAALLAAPTAQALGPACGKGNKSYVGRYEMSGVMEVGSQLVLRADGSFAFALAYGANDQVGAGCWTQTDRVIALFAGRDATRISGTHTPDTRGFTGLLLEKSGRDLLWRIPGSNQVGRYRRY
jgi:hypothetical protein